MLEMEKTMRIRTISNATFQRNMAFWIDRQERGEEIRLKMMGKTVGVLYGEPREEALPAGARADYLEGGRWCRRRSNG
jgi:hypothetical protein